MSPDLRYAIESAASPATVRDAAERSGYAPIVLDAGRLIAAGECCVAEATRVLGVR